MLLTDRVMYLSRRFSRSCLLTAPTSGIAKQPRRSRGFTMVELMVAITIISVLMAILVPTITKIKRRSIAAAVGNDLRTFAAAFDAYAHESGRWPVEVAAGVFPAEMAARIQQTSWTRPTPIGGQFNWDFDQLHQGTRYKAVVAINTTGASPLVQDADMWEAIDKVMDDGVLTTGMFRIGADDEPIFIVAQ